MRTTRLKNGGRSVKKRERSAKRKKPRRRKKKKREKQKGRNAVRDLPNFMKR